MPLRAASRQGTTSAWRASLTARPVLFLTLAALLIFELAWSLLPSDRPFDVANVACWLAAMAGYVATTYVDDWRRSSPPDVDLSRLRLTGSPEEAVQTNNDSILETSRNQDDDEALLQPNADASRSHTSMAYKLSGLGIRLLPVVVLLVATAARLARLEDVPPIIHSDEGESALRALSIALGSPDAPAFFGTSWLFHPALHFYIEASAIKSLGATLFAARLVSAYWGVAAVAATYLAGRVLVGRRCGVLAASIASVAPVMLEMSRYSLDNVESVTLTTLCLALAYSAVSRERPEEFAGRSHGHSNGQTRKAHDGTFALAGVIAGLGIYFYAGSWLLPWLLGLLFGLAVVHDRTRRARLVRGGAILAGGFLVAALPLLVFLVRHPEASGGSRAFGDLFVFTHVAQAEQALRVSGIGTVLAVQVARSLGQFFLLPDASGFFPFDAPILTGAVGALFALGFVVALTRVGGLAAQALLVWFGSTMLVGNVLFGVAPYTPRIVTALPAAFILAAWSLVWFWDRATDVMPRMSPWCPFAAGLLVLAIGVSSINDYFFVYFHDSPAQATSALLRFLVTLPPGTHVYSLAKDYAIAGPHERYIGYRLTFQDVQEPGMTASTVEPTTGAAAFIVFPPYGAEVGVLESRFPNGRPTQVLGPDGLPWFTSYLVAVNSTANTE